MSYGAVNLTFRNASKYVVHSGGIRCQSGSVNRNLNSIISPHQSTSASVSRNGLNQSTKGTLQLTVTPSNAHPVDIVIDFSFIGESGHVSGHFVADGRNQGSNLTHAGNHFSLSCSGRVRKTGGKPVGLEYNISISLSN